MIHYISEKTVKNTFSKSNEVYNSILKEQVSSSLLLTVYTVEEKRINVF